MSDTTLFLEGTVINIFDAVEAVKDEIMEIRKESGKTVK